MRGVAGADDVDSVTISPLGDYFVAQFGYCPSGTLGTDAHPCGLMVYDRDLLNGRGLVRSIGHSDLALDADGREVMVYQQLDTDQLSMVDLATGQNTDLWPIDFSHTPMGFHLSGRGANLPGWALVSTHDEDAASHTWMDDGLFAMELKPNGRVVRLAHTHSIVNQSGGQDYFAEPQATVNRDFTKALFTTNWGRPGTQQVETYLVELESGWDGSCRLACSAAVPATAQVGAEAPFEASATSSGCLGGVAYEWAFGDGAPHGVTALATHAYAATGTYGWSLTATADQRTCAKTGTIQVSQSGTCALSCTASGPAQAVAGQNAAFTGTVTPAGCPGAVTWDWDFGDGSAHASVSAPSHIYAQAGTYTWQSAASTDGLTCVKTGVIQVVPPEPPPVIVTVQKLGAPFRIKLLGQNFQDGLSVFIGADATPWSFVTRKGDTQILLKGGATLKARFVIGQAVGIRVVNPDGQSASVSFTRS
jgi:PKD repeat protein